MPTLEELFRNKKYDRLEGKTPQEAFAVRNSKDIQISTISPLLNATSVQLINKVRLGRNAERFRETRVESELIGLLPFSNFSSAILYGTDILRISSQQTSLGEAMKAGTGGRGLVATAARVVGDTVGEAVQFGGSRLLKIPSTFNAKTAITRAGAAFKNTLGSFFPDVLIPSKIVLSPMFIAKIPGFNEEFRTHEILAKLKDISVGTKLASFLAKNATGTPDQIKQAVIGQGLNIAQQEVKKAVSKQLVRILSKGGDKAQQLAKDIQQSGDASLKYSSLKKYSEVTYGERQYGRPPLNFRNEPSTPDIGPDRDPTGVGRAGIGLAYEELYSGEFDDKKRGKARFLKEKNQEITKYNTNNPIYSKVVRITDRNTIGMTDGRNIRKDTKNTKPPYELVGGIESEAQLKDSENDFVPLKFQSIGTSTMVVFRGTITGLSEQFSPSWDSSRFIGAPFNFYTYQSIERTVQFSFKVFSLNKDEHKICWQKLGYLSSLCYPQSYAGTAGAITAPFLKFTLGDMYRNKECFIENMSYNIDDNYPWEVGLSGKDVQNYRLPTIVEVTITLKFVEAKSNTYNTVFKKDGAQDKTQIGRKLYGFFDDASTESKQNNTPDAKKLQSTNTPYVAPDFKKPSSETNQAEGGDPYPNDSSAEALEVQKRLRLVKTNILHTPPGQTKPRQIYKKRRGGQLYYGDGNPYTGVGDAEYIDSPIDKPIGLNSNSPFETNSNLTQLS
jgi:hypothetical protein